MSTISEIEKLIHRDILETVEETGQIILNDDLELCIYMDNAICNCKEFPGVPLADFLETEIDYDGAEKERLLKLEAVLVSALSELRAKLKSL